MEKNEYICYFDGSCLPVNPSGYMGAGVVVESSENIYEQSIGYPKNTENSNNLAEYNAFHRILVLLKNKKGCNITIYGDSRLVVNQMNEVSFIKGGLYAQRALECLKLLAEIKKENTVNIIWVGREQNARADRLSKVGSLISTVSNQFETRTNVKDKTQVG